MKPCECVPELKQKYASYQIYTTNNKFRIYVSIYKTKGKKNNIYRYNKNSREKNK